MKSLLASIYPYVFALLLLLVPFDGYMRAIPNILLILLAVIFPFVIKKQDFLKLKSTEGYLFFSFFLYLVVSSIVLGRWDDNFPVINKIGIALILVFLFIPIQDFKKINRAIIFSSLLAITYSVYNIVILIYDTGSFNFGDTGNPLETLLIDRLYLGLLCLFSILVSYRGISKKHGCKNNYYFANIFINIAFLFIMVSKIALVTLFFVITLRFLYKGLKKRTIIGIVLGFSAITVLAFLLNVNLGKRFLYATPNSSKYTFIENAMLREPRTKILECSYRIAEKEGISLLGMGFEQTSHKLLECYEDHIENKGRREWFLFKKFNTHNQFVDIYLSAGIIGFLVFIGMFIVMFKKVRKDFFLTALMTTIILFGLVESFFHRQIGAYYFGLFLIYLFYANEINNYQRR